MEHTDFSQSGSARSVFGHMYWTPSVGQKVLSRRVQSKVDAKPALSCPISTPSQSTPVTETSSRWSQLLHSTAAVLLTAEEQQRSFVICAFRPIDKRKLAFANLSHQPLHHSAKVQSCQVATGPAAQHTPLATNTT